MTCTWEAFTDEDYLRLDCEEDAVERPNACVLCGNPDASPRREDDEPLCSACRYEVEHRGAEMYVAQQFSFYNREDTDGR